MENEKLVTEESFRGKRRKWMKMTEKAGWKKKISRAVLFCLSGAALVMLSFCMTMHTKAGARTVRIGYTGQCGFIEACEEGYEGYGVEYLEKLSEYTGWEYEYVYDTWSGCLDKLESGEIDLLCGVPYTKEWSKRFLYSEIPLGYECTTVYAKADSDIYYEDYRAMEGSRVGMLANNPYSKEFRTFATERGMEISPLYFSTECQILSELRNGNLELGVVGSLHNHSDLKIVDRFDVRAFYCITGQQNIVLMNAFNAAMQRMQLVEPEMEMNLSEKYYGKGKLSSAPMFTREEYEYVENAEPIHVKVMEGTRPLSYERDGSLEGIFVKNLELLEEKSGLEFQIEVCSTPIELEEQMQGMLEEGYLVPRARRMLEKSGLAEGLIASEPLLETQLAYVTHREKVGEKGRDDYTFAVTNEMAYLPEMLFRVSEKFQIQYCSSPEECMEAVLNGDADIAIQDSYVIAYMLQKPKYRDMLVECPGDVLTNEMCLITSADNEMLVQVLNKTIAYISKEDRDEIVAMELFMNPYEQGIEDVLYKYGKAILLIVVILIVAIGIYTWMMRRMINLKVRQKEYEILQKKVQQDELTGAYNRTYFYEKAREMIDSTKESMCIILMDISNFKVVNDLYGMENGDRLLCDMAQNLQNLVEGHEFIVARFNSDHFYLCMRKSDFQEIHFPRRYKTFLRDMDITVTYGVFLVEDQRDMPINLMCDRANLAAHDERWKRVEYIRYYSEDERKRIIQEQEIENDMEKALEEEQFCVYVQPKYDVKEENIVGGEALVRWMHPQKGFISPGVFINIFEKNGFIIRLDYYVWEETCRLIAESKKKGVDIRPISINVSRAHFYGKELKDKLEELTAKYGLKPENLELEITETICAEDPDIVYRRIRELQEAGFKVAMDDFGSGYSSLNMLKEMPLDIIKMDLKFLDGGENIEKSRNILRTLISLAQGMNLFVIVEGVETKEQMEFLKGIGNCHIQGYYFSRPVDYKIYEEMLIRERMERTNGENYGGQ